MFEEGFWVGYFERSCGGEYSAARYVFGPEPGAAELSAFVLVNGFDQLVWTRSQPSGLEATLEKNPKRRIREIARSMHDSRAASKARLAVQVELEVRKVERKAIRAAQKALIKDERFLERREQRKCRRRGH